MADEVRVATDTMSPPVYAENVEKGQIRGLETPDDILQIIPDPEEGVDGAAGSLVVALDEPSARTAASVPITEVEGPPPSWLTDMEAEQEVEVVVRVDEHEGL